MRKKWLEKWLENDTKLTAVFAVISAAALVLSLTGVLRGFLPVDVAWIAIVLCGVPILTGAVRGLIFDHDIKADVLVAMALIASVATREYFAAGEVALIMQIGSLLEDYTSGKAQEGIEKLVDLTPRTAHVIRNGAEQILPAEDIRIGDTVRVLAGETIPVDGKILEGITSVDQSVMTGESIPVDRGPGDAVSSGTVNQYGVFTMRAEKVSADSSLQRMVRLAKEAEQNQAPVVSLADRWATWLVLVALACAVLTWIFTGKFMRAVTVLVVFCPCAFILATPTAILAGIGNAARYGIIIRSGSALEKFSRIRRVAFDKTGTLTYGRPVVTGICAAGGSAAGGADADEIRSAGAAGEMDAGENVKGGGFSENDLLRFAAAVEQQSEHPLGKAIVRSFRDRNGWDERSAHDSGWNGRSEALPAASDMRVLAGQGVQAVVEGHTVLAGKPDLMRSRGIDCATLRQKTEDYRSQGATVIYVAVDGRAAGILALSDQIREDTPRTIRKLKAAQVIPMLLTGDNRDSAAAIAKQAGIEEVRADLLPEEKMSVIRRYTGSEEPICMVGDGVNDALALTTADAGIAMGGIGSDIAIESADAVLVSDEIHRIPYLFRLTQKVMAKIRLNITAAMIINITAVILSALGLLNPVTGALWHNCGSVFVVVNAAMLLRFRDEETPVR